LLKVFWYCFVSTSTGLCPWGPQQKSKYSFDMRRFHFLAHLTLSRYKDVSHDLEPRATCLLQIKSQDDIGSHLNPLVSLPSIISPRTLLSKMVYKVAGKNRAPTSSRKRSFISAVITQISRLLRSVARKSRSLRYLDNIDNIFFH
jgi:hypothetical protein